MPSGAYIAASQLTSGQRPATREMGIICIQLLLHAVWGPRLSLLALAAPVPRCAQLGDRSLPGLIRSMQEVLHQLVSLEWYPQIADFAARWGAWCKASSICSKEWAPLKLLCDPLSPSRYSKLFFPYSPARLFEPELPLHLSEVESQTEAKYIKERRYMLVCLMLATLNFVIDQTSRDPFFK